MAETAIIVEGISKRYVAPQPSVADKTLVETISEYLRRPVRTKSSHSQSSDEYWALRDISFAVNAGEVIGVVGRNGAGKSTLLKILSRITAPTTGVIRLRGRIASLLEVGTGFHPELTGRENIYLNGAILGMSRREIARNLDAIIAFAEVERFIDTPVKRYSSGMYLRLAFAVAAHLESEILVVDEVLAVGDLAFQKKCLRQMQVVSQEGRTVLFVSHNMSAVRALCSRAVMLDGGRVVQDGAVDQVVNAYISAGRRPVGERIIPADYPRSMGNGDARFTSAWISDANGTEIDELMYHQPLCVFFEFQVNREISEAVLEIGVVAADGTHVSHSSTIDGGAEPIRVSPGHYRARIEINPLLLPRSYHLALGIHHMMGTTCDWVDHVCDFTVLNVAARPSDTYRWPRVRGYVLAPGAWSLAPVLDL